MAEIITRAEWLATCDVFDESESDLKIEHEAKIAYHLFGKEAIRPGAEDRLNPFKDYSRAQAWRRGFNSEHSLKMAEFREYMKKRRLKDSGHVPPSARASGWLRQMIFERREKSIAWLEARYPDFKPAYEKANPSKGI